MRKRFVLQFKTWTDTRTAYLNNKKKKIMFYYSWSKETFEGFTEKDTICIMNNGDAVGSINIGSIWLS